MFVSLKRWNLRTRYTFQTNKIVWFSSQVFFSSSLRSWNVHSAHFTIIDVTTMTHIKRPFMFVSNADAIFKTRDNEMSFSLIIVRFSRWDERQMHFVAFHFKLFPCHYGCRSIFPLEKRQNKRRKGTKCVVQPPNQSGRINKKEKKILAFITIYNHFSSDSSVDSSGLMRCVISTELRSVKFLSQLLQREEDEKKSFDGNVNNIVIASSHDTNTRKPENNLQNNHFRRRSNLNGEKKRKTAKIRSRLLFLILRFLVEFIGFKSIDCSKLKSCRATEIFDEKKAKQKIDLFCLKWDCFFFCLLPADSLASPCAKFRRNLRFGTGGKSMQPNSICVFVSPHRNRFWTQCLIIDLINVRAHSTSTLSACIRE